MPVPEMLAATLLQRMRGLKRAEREVIVLAAAIGRRFRLAVLAASTAIGEERVRSTLDKACVMQFVVREEAGGDWYSFRHALIRDVAYEEFVASRVRDMHRRILRAIERCAEIDATSLDDLAYHSWVAADGIRCRKYNERAGDAAASAFAHDDARKYFTRAREYVAPGSPHYRRLSSKIAAASDGVVGQAELERSANQP